MEAETKKKGETRPGQGKKPCTQMFSNNWVRQIISISIEKMHGACTVLSNGVASTKGTYQRQQTPQNTQHFQQIVASVILENFPTLTQSST